MKIKITLFVIAFNITAFLIPSFSSAQTSGCGDVTDIDGNVYPTVQIGTQCWTQKNLDVSKYRNGDPIPQVTDRNQWVNLTTGAWCYPENNTANGIVYGKLYNWYAVNDPRGLAPAGWHVADDAEWTTLLTFLGGENVAGGKMKATTGWLSPNTGATNSSGFTGLPGGEASLQFYNTGKGGFWWSSTNFSSGRAFRRALYYSYEYVHIYNELKSFGLSVRCVRDKSWIGFYNIIEDNLETFPKPKILWTGGTSDNPPPIKICADGSKATLIKYVNKDPLISKNDIRFRITSKIGYTNVEWDGAFYTTPTDYKSVGDTIYVKYTHPQHLPVGSSVPYTYDDIQVFDNSNGNTIYNIPIEIYHAPVLMIHGVWANRESFKEMEDDLCSSMYPPIPALTWRADYENANSYSFDHNKDVVPRNINYLINIARNKNYSAGKVIVVGHSMGGLLTRQYIQSSTYRNDIQKLITINTPHAGSQGANFILDHPTVASTMDYFKKNTKNGAVNDLNVVSQALKSLNEPSAIQNHNVPSHAISTVTPWPIGCGWSSYFISIAARIVTGNYVDDFTIAEFLSKLYNSEKNDLIVALSSQQGSDISDPPTDNFQCHLGASASSNVISKVKDLIQRDPSDNVYFLQNGFSPRSLNVSYFKKDQATSISKTTVSGTVTIAPLLSTFHPGDIIPITVTSTGSINDLIVAAGDPSGGINYLDKLGNNAIYNYNVPLDAIGKIKIMATGYDETGFVALDTMQTNVVLNNATLDSIKIYGDPIYVTVNKTESISTTAYFSNGYHYSDSMLSDVQYQIADTKYAKYVGSNLIQGKEAGITMLSVTYLNQTKNIPVVVIPEDITLNTIDHDFSNSEILNINIYPNPTNGIFTIEIQASNNDNLSMKISDLTGRTVYEKKYLKNETKHEVDIRGNAAGIYIVTVRDEKNNIVARKIVKM